VFLQHPGSDNAIWEDVPRLKRFSELRKAASWKNLKLRVGDVSSAIDQLEAWNAKEGHPLFGRLDLRHIGMSGHSFGATTTQNVSGQRNLEIKPEPRIRAAIPMNPSMPRTRNPERTFQTVEIPWLCMTGTNDESLIGGASAESRRKVFESLPEGSKYELVLSEAEHFAFTETSLEFGRKKSAERNPNHQPAIKAISTAFWDSYLLENAEARAWLDGETVRTVLEEADAWQAK
jgi:predicted dienelactone hydrolase